MNKNLLTAMVLIATLGAGVVSAEENCVLSWFKNWKQGLEKTVVESRYRRVRTTSVAAVRGDDQASDVHKPYWKGSISDKKAAQSMAERKELAAAVDLILAGKKDEASKKLDAFEAAHPKSQYLPDVKEARSKLAQL